MRIRLVIDFVFMGSILIKFTAFLHHLTLLQKFMIFELLRFKGLFFHFDFPSNLFELLISFAS